MSPSTESSSRPRRETAPPLSTTPTATPPPRVSAPRSPRTRASRPSPPPPRISRPSPPPQRHASTRPIPSESRSSPSRPRVEHRGDVAPDAHHLTIVRVQRARRRPPPSARSGARGDRRLAIARARVEYQAPPRVPRAPEPGLVSIRREDRAPHGAARGHPVHGARALAHERSHRAGISLARVVGDDGAPRVPGEERSGGGVGRGDEGRHHVARHAPSAKRRRRIVRRREARSPRSPRRVPLERVVLESFVVVVVPEFVAVVELVDAQQRQHALVSRAAEPGGGADRLTRRHGYYRLIVRVSAREARECGDASVVSRDEARRTLAGADDADASSVVSADGRVVGTGGIQERGGCRRSVW